MQIQLQLPEALGRCGFMGPFHKPPFIDPLLNRLTDVGLLFPVISIKKCTWKETLFNQHKLEGFLNNVLQRTL